MEERRFEERAQMSIEEKTISCWREDYQLLENFGDRAMLEGGAGWSFRKAEPLGY